MSCSAALHAYSNLIIQNAFELSSLLNNFQIEAYGIVTHRI